MLKAILNRQTKGERKEIHDLISSFLCHLVVKWIFGTVHSLTTKCRNAFMLWTLILFVSNFQTSRTFRSASFSKLLFSSNFLYSLRIHFVIFKFIMVQWSMWQSIYQRWILNFEVTASIILLTFVAAGWIILFLWFIAYILILDSVSKLGTVYDKWILPSGINSLFRLYIFLISDHTESLVIEIAFHWINMSENLTRKGNYNDKYVKIIILQLQPSSTDSLIFPNSQKMKHHNCNDKHVIQLMGCLLADQFWCTYS